MISIALVLTLVGCVPEPVLTGQKDTGLAGPCADKLLEIGAVQPDFVPFSTGDALVMARAPADGWTFDIALSISGLPNEVAVSGSASRTDTSTQITQDADLAFYAVDNYTADACAGDPVTHRLLLAPDTTGQTQEEWLCDLAGQELAVCIDVGPAEGEGRHAAGCTTVTATLDALDVCP